MGKGDVNEGRQEGETDEGVEEDGRAGDGRALGSGREERVVEDIGMVQRENDRGKDK